jgi:YVTN family beta-propeller protein
MLPFIPKRPNYSDWIKIVAAVGDALPLEDAIELLKEWSPEEQEGEYGDKLPHRLENVHIGTLIHLAKQQGWTPPEKAYSWRNGEPARELQKDIAAAQIDVQSPREGPPLELLPAPAPYRLPPLTLLPSVLQEYVHAAAESLNVDVSFVFLPKLSALASAIGNARSILLKRGFVQPPLTTTAGSQYRQNDGGGGGVLYSQSSEPVHFGLGRATHADLQITSPSGVVDTLSAVPANQTLTVTEGQSVPTKNLFVASSASDSVAVVDPSTNQVITQIRVGRRPIRIAMTPDEQKAYVSNGGDLTLSVIDTANLVVTSTCLELLLRAGAY